MGRGSVRGGIGGQQPSTHRLELGGHIVKRSTGAGSGGLGVRAEGCHQRTVDLTGQLAQPPGHLPGPSQPDRGVQGLRLHGPLTHTGRHCRRTQRPIGRLGYAIVSGRLPGFRQQELGLEYGTVVPK
jgi:hypothetical protein